MGRDKQSTHRATALRCTVELPTVASTNSSIRLYIRQANRICQTLLTRQVNRTHPEAIDFYINSNSSNTAIDTHQRRKERNVLERKEKTSSLATNHQERVTNEQ
jgi:uncharacterized membrane-anchored protein